MVWLKRFQSLLPLLLILLLALSLRIIFLNEIPPGIANDEINIVINAQSLLHTGQNIPGVVTGILGKTSGDLGAGIHSEISSWLIVPFIALFGFSWPVVKLPFIVFSLGIVCLSYLLVKKFFNHEAGLIAALLSAVSPWSIFFARSGYEAIFSSFFYLLAIYIIFEFKSWKILWSTPIFILGLLSYFSAKTLMLPLAVIALVGIKFIGPKSSFKPTLVVNLILLLFLIIYLPLLSKSPAGARFQELKDQNTQTVTNLKRTQSLDFPFSSLYENKYAEEIKFRLTASFGTFSPNRLFLDGSENIPSLSIPDHGPLYLIDLVLIIVGVFYLIEKNKGLFLTFLGFMAVTMIPNFLNLQGTTFMLRTVILFPILTLISALGIYRLKNVFGSHRSIAYLIIFTVYLLFVGNFAFQYFARLPIDKNEGWFFPDRVASRYIKLALESNGEDITLVSSTPKQTAYRYLLFSKLYNTTKSIKEINSKFAMENYTIGKLKITGDCSNKSTGASFIIDTTMKCATGLKGSSIASIKDGRAQYIITNDQVCRPYITRHYPLIKDINLLNIEHLSTADFCQNFLTNISF